MQGEILIEVAGPGVRPRTVAARELLALASAYLDAIAGLVRDERDHELTIQGIRIVAKCAAVMVHADRGDLAAEAGAQATRYLTNLDDAPHGVRKHLGRLAAAIGELPPQYTPSARFRTSKGEQVFKLEVVRPEVTLPAFEVVVLRAEPIKAGGNEPEARFEARGEGRFTLKAPGDWDTIRKVGASLHKPCDIVAKVRRNAEGVIEGGEILAVEIPDADSRGAWEKWYAANARNVSFESEQEGSDE
ncbi:MAG: hypothetical protein QM704_14825 [Anaeromyxobacteraceae bacterium]